MELVQWPDYWEVLSFPAMVWAVCCWWATYISARPEAPRLCGQLAATADDGAAHSHAGRRCPPSLPADIAAGRAGQTVFDAVLGRDGRNRPVNRLYDASAGLVKPRALFSSLKSLQFCFLLGWILISCLKQRRNDVLFWFSTLSLGIHSWQKGVAGQNLNFCLLLKKGPYIWNEESWNSKSLRLSIEGERSTSIF